MSKLKKSEIKNAIDILLHEYPDAGCELAHKNDFELLVAVVLSAQTTDASVNRVTPALFEKAPDAAALADMPVEEIGELIRSIGMYNTKAKNIKALARMLCDSFEGKVPADPDELQKLPGVGRKTANVVMAECFGAQTIAVDTHVFRLANRIGLVDEKNVFGTELSLQKVIDRELWTKMHHALIWHGRRVCSAKNPACVECCLNGICKKNGVNKDGKHR